MEWGGQVKCCLFHLESGNKANPDKKGGEPLLWQLWQSARIRVTKEAKMQIFQYTRVRFVYSILVCRFLCIMEINKPKHSTDWLQWKQSANMKKKWALWHHTTWPDLTSYAITILGSRSCLLREPNILLPWLSFFASVTGHCPLCIV